jgi:hypothetical protein
MRSGANLFQFEIEPALRDLAGGADSRPGAQALALPFLTVHVHPSAKERDVAAEIVLRVGDKRVLNAQECCDGCIDSALSSLQEIRARLVDARVALAGEKGALSGLVELMLTAMRQFLTFEQRLPRNKAPRRPGDEFYRDSEVRQAYFDTLEQLRGHLSRCLGAAAAMAGMNQPSDGLIAGYAGPWPAEAYVPFDPASLVP